MEDPRKQLIRMASDAELERRWSQVREVMRAQGIDFLVMQNSEEFMGGTLRWFTDWIAHIGFPFTVVFPVDEGMTVINWGHERPEIPDFPPPWCSRGIKNSWAAYYMPTHRYTSEIDASMAVEALSSKKNPVVGWVEKSLIPVTFYQYVTRNLPGAAFVDATEWIDELRVPKSPEEIEMIRETAAMQDACFEHLRKTIRPGMRGYELNAEATYFCTKRGSSRMNCMISSAPLGMPAAPASFHLQGREIRKGDQVFVLVECNGPGGQWAELGRTFVVDTEPSALLLDVFADSVEGRSLVVEKMVPGMQPRDLVAVARDFYAKKGYRQEVFDLAHGMGYSMVERPMLRDMEPMSLRADSNIAVHLSTLNDVKGDEAFAMPVDNYLVKASGPPERLHTFPEEIIVV